MDLDVGSLFILIGVLLVPAIIVFIVLNVIRIRRGKFHRQRVKRTSKKEEEAE